MWDSSVNAKFVKKEIVRDEDVKYEIEIDSFLYQVFIISRRRDETPEDVSLEIHFSAKRDENSEYTSDLTGRNNASKVLHGVWECVTAWAKEVSKGGYLKQLIVAAKSEEEGDPRRARIYSSFIAKKASSAGIKILNTRDITEPYTSMMSMMSGPTYKMVVTAYDLEKFPLETLKKSDK
jgi:hypothetical protein